MTHPYVFILDGIEIENMATYKLPKGIYNIYEITIRGKKGLRNTRNSDRINPEHRKRTKITGFIKQEN